MKGLFLRYLYFKYQNPISYGSKDIAQVKFLKLGQSSRLRSKVLVLKERSLHEVFICEITEPYPIWFKRYSQG
jgi:hypothetical protein